MTHESEILEWVSLALSGDAQVIGRLAALNHDQLTDIAFRVGDFTLTRKAVLRAISDYRSGQISDAELVRWAWFVRRGYVPGSSQGPVSPLKIDYERGFEEAIVAALTRFSELGDAVDGTIEPGELDQLASRLGSQAPRQN